MSCLDRDLLAERAGTLERHLRRVAERLPARFDAGLAGRLARAAGFRNIVAHAYERLDMRRVHDAALHGPADLRALLAALRDRLPA